MPVVARQDCARARATSSNNPPGLRAIQKNSAGLVLGQASAYFIAPALRLLAATLQLRENRIRLNPHGLSRDGLPR
jgi:hypothetical protein